MNKSLLGITSTFTPQKLLVIPRKRWLRPNMTEKLFTGTLRTNQPTIDINTLGRPFSIWLCVLPNLFATVILAFSVTLIRMLAQLKLLLINMIAMVALEVLVHLLVRGHNISSTKYMVTKYYIGSAITLNTYTPTLSKKVMYVFMPQNLEKVDGAYCFWSMGGWVTLLVPTVTFKLLKLES